MTPPDNPAGEYLVNSHPTAEQRWAAIDTIKALPGELRAAVAGLGEPQLNTVYKNWTVRQIVHHLGDSHANALLRFKLALTEDSPRIFAYQPTPFVELPDSKTLPIEVSLNLLEAIHTRWVCVLESLTDVHFDRGYHHPEQNRIVPLREAIGLYAWHGRHHTAQIRWLRTTRGW